MTRISDATPKDHHVRLRDMEILSPEVRSILTLIRTFADLTAELARVDKRDFDAIRASVREVGQTHTQIKRELVALERGRQRVPYCTTCGEPLDRPHNHEGGQP